MALPLEGAHRAAAGYLEEWVPRFMPYHADLVRELALAAGQRVLVTSCGPGVEVVSVARVVGETGHVRATDARREMVDLCASRVAEANMPWVTCAVADASDTSGGPWDGVVCAFGLWQIEARSQVIEAWGRALTEHGKVGVMTFGPPDVDDPFELLAAKVRELEPSVPYRAPRVNADRQAMRLMFEDAGLAMVRHTVVRHTMSFSTAEGFVAALRHASTWRSLWEAVGDVPMERVAAKFYDAVGGPGAALGFAPAATIAIAVQPGAEVELAHRPSVRAPTAPKSRGGGGVS
jgi:ubiquinone/menaquinone biosynthesis C-methylase UbiE